MQVFLFASISVFPISKFTEIESVEGVSFSFFFMYLIYQFLTLIAGKNNKMAPRIYGSDAGIAEDTKRY